MGVVGFGFVWEMGEEAVMWMLVLVLVVVLMFGCPGSPQQVVSNEG